MKLKKLTISIFAAVAAFTVGIGAYAAVGFAQSLLPKLSAKAEAFDRIPISEPATAVPVQAEPVMESPAIDSESTASEPVDETDWTGNYELYSETLPKAFSDVESLEIETHEYDQDTNDSWTSKRIVPKGSMQAKQSHWLNRIAIGGDNLAFQTATVDGVSYKFTGRFIARDSCGGGTPNLKGRLIKIKDNKWAAEMQAEFYISCGC